MGGEAEFERFRRRVKDGVDARLAAFFAERIAALPRVSADLETVLDAVRSLAMRGGKRLRAVLLAAAYEACGGEGGAERVVMAGVSIELLQTYLLIHDDVMDDDDVRRGGPSVHAMLRERFGSARAGETAAILAGDLASALAQEAMLAVPLAADRVAEAARELARMQEAVCYGQLLDMRASSNDRDVLEAMHALKTGSYTVKGPLLAGAILAGASAPTREKLARFAAPLGVAFQLRDDLLGVFGDPSMTGKPSGSDLREGKRTALVVELAGDADGQELLSRVLGVKDSSPRAIDEVLSRMVVSGAKGRVEVRLASLMREAQAALEAINVTQVGRAVLSGAVRALGDRQA